MPGPASSRRHGWQATSRNVPRSALAAVLDAAPGRSLRRLPDLTAPPLEQQRAPSVSIVARRSCPASILTSTSWCQVAIGSAPRLDVRSSPGGRRLGPRDDVGVPSGRSCRRQRRRSRRQGRSPLACPTLVAQRPRSPRALSWPSRNTVALTWKRSRRRPRFAGTTGRRGPAGVTSTNRPASRMEVIRRRPTTLDNATQNAVPRQLQWEDRLAASFGGHRRLSSLRAHVRATPTIHRPHRVLPAAAGAGFGDLVANLRWSWHAPTRRPVRVGRPGRSGRPAGGDPVPHARRASAPERLRRAGGSDAQVPGAASTPRRRRPGRVTSPPPRWYQSARRAAGRWRRRPGPGASPTSRRSTASPRCCRSTRAASASSPATTSRRPATSAYRSSGSACSTARVLHASRCHADGWQLERYPAARPQRPADHTPSTGRDGAARVKISVAAARGSARSSRAGLARPGRPGAAAAAGQRRRGERPRAARLVTDRLYGGGSRAPAPPGDCCSALAGCGHMRAYCAHRPANAGSPRSSTPTRGTPASSASSGIRELVQPAPTVLLLRRGPAGCPAAARCSPRTRRCPPASTASPRELHRGLTSRAPAAVLAVDRVLALGAETYPGGDPHVFNMAHHGPALAAERVNGVSSAARRGQPRDVRRPVAGLRHRRGPDRLGHQRRARAHLDVAREVLEILEKRRGPRCAGRRPRRSTRRCGDWIRRSTAARDAELWSVRETLRERLVREILRSMRASYVQRGMAEARTRLDRRRPSIRERADDRASPAGCRPTSGSR